MEQHNIGTDATVAEHIQKQLDRGYATKDASLTFWPTPLGEALVGAYRKMGLENLWLPNLRQVLLCCTVFHACFVCCNSFCTHAPAVLKLHTGCDGVTLDCSKTILQCDCLCQQQQCTHLDSPLSGVMGDSRGTIEANINAVARGTRTKESVLQEAVDFFKADFISASQKQSMSFGLL